MDLSCRSSLSRLFQTSKRDPEDAHLTHAFVDLHDDDPEFGCRFLTDKPHAAGAAAAQAVHDDLVRRTSPQSGLTRCDWPTDRTPSAEGKLYCGAIKDPL